MGNKIQKPDVFIKVVFFRAVMFFFIKIVFQKYINNQKRPASCAAPKLTAKLYGQFGQVERLKKRRHKKIK